MSPEQAFKIADEIIADVQRGSEVARQLVAARIMLVRAQGEAAGFIEASETTARFLPPARAAQ